MNDEPDETSRSFTTTLTVERTPEEVFAAITNVRGWWSGDIEGPTDQVGGEFTYRYEDLHYSKQQVTELVPGKRVVWLVVDSSLQFVEDKREWNGTRVTFDIARKGDKTEIRFTHAGLLPTHECYPMCSSALERLRRRQPAGDSSRPGRASPTPRRRLMHGSAARAPGGREGRTSMNIEGCVALVTGANRGLGKAIVASPVESGAAKVYAAARDERSILAAPASSPSRSTSRNPSKSPRPRSVRATSPCSSTTRACSPRSTC